MKQVKICYTKVYTAEVKDDITREEMRELIDEIAWEKIFQDNEYTDDVEWEVWE